MGNTDHYAIPYPEQYDIPDGAGQMKAIADRVDQIVKGNADAIATNAAGIASNTASIAQMPNQLPKPLWTVYSNAITADVGTTTTVGFTAPSAVYKAGRAYRLELVTHIRCTVAATQMNLYVLDTNTSGTSRGAIFHWIPTPGQNIFFTWPWNVVNTTGADITRVLVLAFKSSSATNLVALNAMTVGNRYWVCTDIGLAADHPEAVAL